MEVEIELNKWMAEMSSPINIICITSVEHSGNIMTIVYYQK